jgi:hypothetical protein
MNSVVGSLHCMHISRSNDHLAEDLCLNNSMYTPLSCGASFIFAAVLYMHTLLTVSDTVQQH